MRIHVLAFTAALSLIPIAAIAGPGHEHGHSHAAINQVQAESVAVKNIARLVESGKIDKSWAGVKVAKVEKKTFGSTPEWVVVFQNNEIADAAKRTLYVFLSVDGEYLAANHTGK